MRVTRQFASFWLLWLFFSALWWRQLFATFGLAVHQDEFTHILLILPISAALIGLECKAWKQTAAWNLRAGLSLAALGVVIALASRWWLAAPDVKLSANMLALVILWIASFVICFGTRAASVVTFALCFLFWMVPIPEFLLLRVAQMWQRGSAFAASLLFSAVGVPCTQDGIFLSIPDLNLEVARECSSLRSSLMLIVTTMVLAHLFLRTPWRKALAILVAVPLSIAKNGLRIFVIGMLTTRVDPSFMTGRLHHKGGIVFFLIALAAILLLIWILRKTEGTIADAAKLSPAL